MKEHCIEKVVAAFWFFLLGILVLPSILCSYHLNLESTSASLVLGVIFAGIGFFYGHRTFLLAADNLDGVIVRCVAGAWAGALGSFFAMMSLLGVADQINLYLALYWILLVIIMFLLGWFYGYQWLLFPKINDEVLFPTWCERFITALWFGMVGCIALAPYNLTIHDDPMKLFTILLASYLGFAYGWRILRLPRSGRSILKAGMIGFIGSSYAVLIFLWMTSISLMVNKGMPIVRAPLMTPMLDGIMQVILGMFMIFGGLGWLIWVIVVFFSFMLYFIAGRKNKNTFIVIVLIFFMAMIGRDL